MTDRARRPVAAGTFYPGETGELTAEVDRLLAGATPPTLPSDPVGLIVPHAGYGYSGPVAATGYALLARTQIPRARRVVLLGPSHFVPLWGTVVPETTAWGTPLGSVQVDQELADVAEGCGASRDDGPHAHDHALEVQLPFLQRALGASFSVLPVAVGESVPGEVASLISALAEVPAFVIVSTDLSHYHDDATARAMDARTAQAVLNRTSSAIEGESACGSHALRGLVEYAALSGLAFTLLDLRTSADATGERRGVVGYGAFALVA